MWLSHSDRAGWIHERERGTAPGYRQLGVDIIDSQRWCDGEEEHNEIGQQVLFSAWSPSKRGFTSHTLLAGCTTWYKRNGFFTRLERPPVRTEPPDPRQVRPWKSLKVPPAASPSSALNVGHGATFRRLLAASMAWHEHEAHARGNKGTTVLY